MNIYRLEIEARKDIIHWSFTKVIIVNMSFDIIAHAT